MSDVEQRLKDIEEREKLATKAPWAFVRDSSKVLTRFGVNDSDYDLICHARTDIPFLLAIARKYREALIDMYSDSVKYPQLELHEHHQRRVDEAITYNPNESEAKK